MPPTEAMKQQLSRVELTSTVKDGKMIGEYDFYNFIAAFEGKRVRLTVEAVETTQLELPFDKGKT